ncbi:hypothetical protein CONLIGDRAFT_503867 [Coniochaeta ligniaria NRRL 30616]|uniref:Uncharacterized protein n=1 Tax=Coniochaeta ligniaria NRRL 30616 TaxID=1408157 RepID=A0A1J7IDJ3_9PEZI|nr:hypothetical protein CONLIGDRAFT_503867 [Coniochaeta ligniaria NRRL 30616]
MLACRKICNSAHLQIITRQRQEGGGLQTRRHSTDVVSSRLLYPVWELPNHHWELHVGWIRYYRGPSWTGRLSNRNDTNFPQEQPWMEPCLQYDMHVWHNNYDDASRTQSRHAQPFLPSFHFHSIPCSSENIPSQKAHACFPYPPDLWFLKIKPSQAIARFQRGQNTRHKPSWHLSSSPSCEHSMSP